jgi:uncharacterized protein (DUF362 family)
MSLVSFVRGNPDRAILREAIQKSLYLINFRFEKRIKKIVIKPNMCYYYHPSTGEVTDPRFVGALINVLRDNIQTDPEIFVVESDASAMKCKYAFKILGYDKMAEEEHIKLVNLSEQKCSIVNVMVNNSNLKFHVPDLLYESDLIVNVPKLKYMSNVKITCALKNMFGCNAYPRKSIYHRLLNEAIVGINKIIKTDLIVVDGITVRGKITKHLGLVMSSQDLVALDSAASTLMGMKPSSVRQIVLALNEGIGSLKFSPVGDFLYFKELFPKKDFKDKVRGIVALIYLHAIQDNQAD